MRDTDVFLKFLHDRADVDDAHLGITGYCMGGRLALYAAGHFGERVTAAAAYHPGGVATDAPDSGHRLAAGIRGRIYIARAIDDATFDDDAKARLEDAYQAAHVDYELETYNAKHGFVPRDTPVHDPVAAARHWQSLLALFEQTLRD
jgi:carboxymethylenebutenolidase